MKSPLTLGKGWKWRFHATTKIYAVVYDTTRPDDETVGTGSHRGQGAHEIRFDKHVYMHAEGYEHNRDGGYGGHGKHKDVDNRAHGKCGEYVAGVHSVCIQLIQWYNHAEVSEHDVTNTDDRHASRSWRHLRRSSRGA